MPQQFRAPTQFLGAPLLNMRKHPKITRYLRMLSNKHYEETKYIEKKKKQPRRTRDNIRRNKYKE